MFPVNIPVEDMVLVVDPVVEEIEPAVDPVVTELEVIVMVGITPGHSSALEYQV